MRVGEPMAKNGKPFTVNLGLSESLIVVFITLLFAFLITWIIGWL